MSLWLGIDTSNYTTSIGVAGDRVVNLRQIIDIKEGMCGIRQSDGVFVHLKTFPKLFDTLDIDMSAVRAIGVSTRPRSQEGSYMPVFVAGQSFAQVIAKSLDVPIYEFSHQDGHIMAGIMSGDYEELTEGDFCAVHMSGGTTEILKCRYNGNGFDVEIVGGTLDIAAGQLIDRLGVSMGMKFPCGKEIDRLSLEQNHAVHLKTAVKDGYMNFSGLENKLKQMQEEPSIKARTVLLTIGESIAKAVNFQNAERVLFVGGVASSEFLREYLKENINAKVFFAQGGLSSDNAVGIAELAKRKEQILCRNR